MEMTYFKNQSGQVYAYDETQLHIVPAEFVKLTDEEVEAHINPVSQPSYRTQFTSLEYLDRFTDAEQLAVVGATMTNPAVKLWYDRMGMASYVDITDPRVAAGIDALIEAGLLDAGRKDALLQPLEI